jgi:hypothetical protein
MEQWRRCSIGAMSYVDTFSLSGLRYDILTSLVSDRVLVIILTVWNVCADSNNNPPKIIINQIDAVLYFSHS